MYTPYLVIFLISAIVSGATSSSPKTTPRFVLKYFRVKETIAIIMTGANIIRPDSHPKDLYLDYIA